MWFDLFAVKYSFIDDANLKIDYWYNIIIISVWQRSLKFIISTSIFLMFYSLPQICWCCVGKNNLITKSVIFMPEHILPIY